MKQTAEQRKVKASPGWLFGAQACAYVGCHETTLRGHLRNKRRLNKAAGIYEFPEDAVKLLKTQLKVFGYKSPKKAAKPDVPVAVSGPVVAAPTIKDALDLKKRLTWILTGYDQGIISDRGALELIRNSVSK